jgi:dihydroxyacetone kinase-like protein
MKNYLSLDEVREMLLSVSATIVNAENYLTEIDLAVGDGDHGTGMALGFGEVKKMLLQTREYPTVRALFLAVGSKLIDTMGGASGILFGTFFISGIRDVESEKTLNLKDFARIFENACRAISVRGRAKPGEKTMLDALYPAAEALRDAVKNDLPLAEGLLLASQKAIAGAEATKDMRASTGRAREYREASIGHQDPGATSVSLIVESMCRYTKTAPHKCRE